MRNAGYGEGIPKVFEGLDNIYEEVCTSAISISTVRISVRSVQETTPMAKGHATETIARHDADWSRSSIKTPRLPEPLLPTMCDCPYSRKRRG